jgi:hypothetical protein
VCRLLKRTLLDVILVHLLSRRWESRGSVQPPEEEALGTHACLLIPELV